MDMTLTFEECYALAQKRAGMYSNAITPQMIAMAHYKKPDVVEELKLQHASLALVLYSTELKTGVADVDYTKLREPLDRLDFLLQGCDEDAWMAIGFVMHKHNAAKSVASYDADGEASNCRSSVEAIGSPEMRSLVRELEERVGASKTETSTTSWWST